MAKSSEPDPEQLAQQAAEKLEAGEDPGSIDFGKVALAWQEAMRPDKVVDESFKLYQEMFKIIAGSSEIAPDRKDWRFKDDAWSTHPFYKRVGQAYLAWSDALNRLADGAENWQTRERAKLATDILTSAASPTNTFWGNPAALKRALETGGQSILEGAQHYLEDLVNNGGMPSQVDDSPFKVGENLAATPGSVVLQTDMFELIQYQPTTSEVRTRPLLAIPPQINKFYFLDLSPGRSLMEYAVGCGLQTFIISWRNPTAQQAHWNIDSYVAALLEAADAVRSISGTEDINTIGFCAGGITMTAMLGYLAAKGDRRIHSAAYAVTLLDFETEAMIGALRSKNVLKMAKSNSQSKGVIRGRDLGVLFTWMRPNDLVWSYWVNNYLMGKKPPSFDILAWNADSTNLPSALHADFLELFENNWLCKPGAWKVLGEPVELPKIAIDTLVTGGLTDHLTPWQGCYRTTQLLSGQSTFVLSNAGHIASLVNPPGGGKSSYHLGGEPGPDPAAWLASATKHEGSWWEYWSKWTERHSGALRTAPAVCGSAHYELVGPAPGVYVHG